ncbi:MAG TPA: metallopeptidase TldD-related protein [Bryobacteraceae bacterium]|nr:metallopeptidase TldD-related protein [Bryobacteraceae bacterium]
MLTFRAALLCAWAAAALAQSPPPLVRILSDELDRNFRVLKEKGDPAPYYMAYSVTELDAVNASAALGAVKSSGSERLRVLDITVRVGTPNLDNYHRLRGEFAQFTSAVALPIEDSTAAIQRRLWLETDRVYRRASERLIKVRSAQNVKAAEDDDSGDFSTEEPALHFSAPPPLTITAEQAAGRVRSLSAGFAQHAGVVSSLVSFNAQRQVRYLVATDGTRIQHGRRSARISIVARAKALDGTDIVLGDNFDAEDPSGLPKDDAVAAVIAKAAGEVAAMLRAPVAQPYVGPALLSGRAAAVLFHEIFGHRVEGHRQKDEADGQTFTKSVGTPVLPDFLSVVFDPTLRRAGNAVLSGWYEYDDEGVAARPVTVVDKGVLRSFLMSRSPVRGFAKSNGHGRRAPGFEVVARQSNLIVESARRESDAKLRQALVEEVRRQGKTYGLYLRDVTGGFTTTAREGLQAFKVMPVVVYRVFADGRPDELIRGADVVGTPLASFSKIIATSDKSEVFNGFCGAESGSVPAAAVAPAMLISELEVQMKPRSQDRPPLLPPPGSAR